MREKPSHREDGDDASDDGTHARGNACAPLTDRVNVEPPILNGMTASEAKVIGIAAFVCWGVLGVLLAWGTGVWQMVLACAVPGPMVTVWTASTKLARIKRNRPDGYYRQAINMWLAERGLRSSVFISHDGHWELGRGLDVALGQVQRRKQRSKR